MLSELKKRNERIIQFFFEVLIPIWQSGRNVDYYQYIQSPAWRKKADEAKQRAGYRCQICNRSVNEIQIEAHHRTYERLGHEEPEDLTVLCRDCHELYESNRRMR